MCGAIRGNRALWRMKPNRLKKAPTCPLARCRPPKTRPHSARENSRTREDRLTKLLQLMQRLLAGSLSRPRMIFSCRSSSLTRLAIAAGSPPPPNPGTHSRASEITPKPRRNGPRSDEAPARSGPLNHRSPIEAALPHLRVVGAPSSVRVRARAGPAGSLASPREIPRARACGGRGGGETTRVVAAASEKARLFCCCCVASLRVFNRGGGEGKKKTFTSWGFAGGR